jgi:hypothetical protein
MQYRRRPLNRRTRERILFVAVICRSRAGGPALKSHGLLGADSKKNGLVAGIPFATLQMFCDTKSAK